MSLIGLIGPISPHRQEEQALLVGLGNAADLRTTINGEAVALHCLYAIGHSHHGHARAAGILEGRSLAEGTAAAVAPSGEVDGIVEADLAVLVALQHVAFAHPQVFERSLPLLVAQRIDREDGKFALALDDVALRCHFGILRHSRAHRQVDS